MSHARGLKPVMPILLGACVMLALAMGLRQSLGLFVQPATRDLSMAVSEFTLALAVQNLMWGIGQPIAGAFAGRFGAGPVMMVGAVMYAAGLILLATAGGPVGVMIGAGILIGLAMACTAMAMALAVASRSVPPAIRSTMLGVVSAAGSLGTLFAAPAGQYLVETFDWRVAVFGFALAALFMLPAAWAAGRSDRIAVPVRAGEDVSGRAAFRAAMRSGRFLIMSGAYFVCGLQLVFLTTHLPSYIEICGLDPMLGAQALGLIGAFNVLGSLFFGWAGQRWSKTGLLGGLYISRSLVLAIYFGTPPTPESTLIFASVMGFLWLGVGPLVAGAVAEMFGVRWQAMIQGIAFLWHQVGSFVGAFGGGALYDVMGSYDLAWKLGVAMGITAGVIQILASLPSGPSLRPQPG